MDDLKMIAEFLAEPPPAEDTVARGRARLARLTRQPRGTAGPVTAPPVAGPGRRRWSSRRVLAGAVAAGVLIAGGAAYGITARLSGSPAGAGSHPQAVAGLTAVRGCPGLYAAAGTLERVTGTSLVIKSALTGQPLTVTTTAATGINRQAAGTLSDITDGTQVFVAGAGLHRPALAAGWVVIGLDLLKHSHPIHHHLGGHPGIGNTAAGTVTGTHAGGFTVIMPSGTRVPVTTSSSTTVLTLQRASIGGLRTGERIDAVGSAGPHGTLAAATIDQGTALPVTTSPPGTAGCSSSAVASAFLTAPQTVSAS